MKKRMIKATVVILTTVVSGCQNLSWLKDDPAQVHLDTTISGYGVSHHLTLDRQFPTNWMPVHMSTNVQGLASPAGQSRASDFAPLAPPAPK